MSAKKLKDWYDGELLTAMAARLQESYERFPSQRFVELASDGLEALEMMDRVRQIARALHATLPGATAQNMAILVHSMGTPLPQAEDGSTPIGSGYALWPYGEFIGEFGLDDWEASWQAMMELTQRLTAEFAVRPFLAADLKQALERLGQLTDHPSHHVRRWVSEGTRTRLPWAKAVPALRGALTERLKLLEVLKSDESLYVRRSVANHLQDILKDDQDSGLEVLERWASSSDPRVAWVVRHAARGLLKSGHRRVLALFGWDQPVTVSGSSLSAERLELGETAVLELTLGNPGELPLPARLDYALEGPTSGGRGFRKVFRWTDLELLPGAKTTLRKSHAFVERSTRKLPAGDYSFTLLLNGLAVAKHPLQLSR